MAYNDVPNNYGDNYKPETEMPETSYDADDPQQFLCDGAGDESFCDFGYGSRPVLPVSRTSGVMYFR